MYVQQFFIIYVSTRKATKIFVLYIHKQDAAEFLSVFICIYLYYYYYILICNKWFIKFNIEFYEFIKTK